MDAIDKLALMADLSDARCETCPIQVGPVPAIDYLVIDLVHQENGDKNQLVIPMCADCIESLLVQEDPWVLLYCLDCASSQWIDTNKSKLDYTNKIHDVKHKFIALEGCPKCSDEPRGVYFGLLRVGEDDTEK